jgi:hypothetical protein
MAIMVGLMKFSIFAFYAYALYVGSWFIELGIANTSFTSTSGVYDFQTVI